MGKAVEEANDETVDIRYNKCDLVLLGVYIQTLGTWCLGYFHMQFKIKAVYKLGGGKQCGRQKQVSRQVLSKIRKAVLKFQAWGGYITNFSYKYRSILLVL